MPGTRSDAARTTFRVRQIPSYIRFHELGPLLHRILGLSESIDQILVDSLAASIDSTNDPPTKVATVRFLKIPEAFRNDKKQWIYHRDVSGLSHNLIIDIHFLGFTTLNDVNPEKHTIDCFAISGLSSHPFGSWKAHDSNFMWLRDAIPTRFRTTRVVIYGYDTNLENSESFQSIEDIALSLIANLRSIGSTLISAKPTIFMAHSLGGVALKQALVHLANSTRQSVFLSKIQKIIFFGVPNRGMEVDHLYPLVRGQPNRPLVDLLKEDSDYLSLLEEQFSGISFVRTVHIVSVYETRRSPIPQPDGAGGWERSGPHGPHEILLKKESAIHRFSDAEDVYPVDKDHSNLVKFSEGEQDLTTILRYLEPRKRLLSRVAPPHQSRANVETRPDMGDSLHSIGKDYSIDYEESRAYREQASSMLESLQKVDTKSRYKQISNAHRTTFDWVLKRGGVGLAEWFDDDRELFWINGKPGSGKSTLMKFICENRHTNSMGKHKKLGRTSGSGHGDNANHRARVSKDKKQDCSKDQGHRMEESGQSREYYRTEESRRLADSQQNRNYETKEVGMEQDHDWPYGASRDDGYTSNDARALFRSNGKLLIQSGGRDTYTTRSVMSKGLETPEASKYAFDQVKKRSEWGNNGLRGSVEVDEYDSNDVWELYRRTDIPGSNISRLVKHRYQDRETAMSVRSTTLETSDLSVQANLTMKGNRASDAAVGHSYQDDGHKSDDSHYTADPQHSSSASNSTSNESLAGYSDFADDTDPTSREPPGVTEAHFFFSHRGTEIQRSFEGLLHCILFEILGRGLPWRHNIGAWREQIRDDIAATERAIAIKEQQLQRIKDMYNDAKTKVATLDSYQVEVEDLEYEAELMITRIEKQRLELRKLRSVLDQPTYNLNNTPQSKIENAHLLHKPLQDWLSRPADEREDWNVTDLEATLIQILRQRIVPVKIVLYLDALDEYAGNPEKIAKFLIHAIKQTRNSMTKLKICFSSRPWDVFKDLFANQPGFCMQEHTKEDIHDYTKAKMKGHSRLDVLPRELANDLQSEILRRAEGVFLWVQLVLESLLVEITRGASSTELLAILAAFPDGLEDLYITTLNRIEDRYRRESYLMLEIVLRSDKLLTFDEFWKLEQRALLSFINVVDGFQGSSQQDIAYHNDYRLFGLVSRRIRSRCGGLLEIRNGVVQLMHQTVQTVQEFLFRPGTMKHLLQPGDTLATLNGHSFLTRALITQLTNRASNRIRRTVGHRPNSVGLLYSCMHHANKAEASTGLSQITLDDDIAELEGLSDLELPLFARDYQLAFAVVADLRIYLRAIISQFPMSPRDLGMLLHIAIEFYRSRSTSDRETLTSLKIADLSGMVKLLLELGAKPLVCVHGMPALQCVFRERVQGAIRAHLSNGPAIEIAKVLLQVPGIDPNGDVILAAPSGDLPSSLLRSPSNGNALLETCKPLHVAGSVVMARLLLDAGADVNGLNDKGQTPLDVLILARTLDESYNEDGASLAFERLLRGCGGVTTIAEPSSEGQYPMVQPPASQHRSTQPLKSIISNKQSVHYGAVSSDESHQVSNCDFPSSTTNLLESRQRASAEHAGYSGLDMVLGCLCCVRPRRQ